jgi:hypothetical protein
MLEPFTRTPSSRVGGKGDMIRIRAIALAAAVLLAGLLAAGGAGAATYRGKSVDGRRYQASVLNHDYGIIDGVEVRFHGDHAYVYLQGGGRLVLFLQEEDIADPRRVLADDPRRGIVWEINVKDLAER